MDIFSAIATGLGAVSSLFGMKKADDEAKRQRNAQKKLLDRQLAAFDKRYQSVMEMEKSGAFDPNKSIELLDKDTARYESIDAGNMAGAYRTAGYQPGDSAIEKGLTAVKTRYRDYRERTANDIRNQKTAQKMSAYNQLDGSGLNTGIAVAGENAARAEASRPNFGAILQSLMPYLNRSGGGASSSSGSSSISLGTGGFMNYQPGYFDMPRYTPGKKINVEF